MGSLVREVVGEVEPARARVWIVVGVETVEEVTEGLSTVCGKRDIAGRSVISWDKQENPIYHDLCPCVYHMFVISLHQFITTELVQTQQTVCATAVNESSTIYSYTCCAGEKPENEGPSPSTVCIRWWTHHSTHAVSFPGLHHIQFLQYAKMDREAIKTGGRKFLGMCYPPVWLCLFPETKLGYIRIGFLATSSGTPLPGVN